MLHGFLWLGLDVQLSCKLNLLLVVSGHLEEHSHVVQLSLQVSVENGLVALAASPEHYRGLGGEGEGGSGEESGEGRGGGRGEERREERAGWRREGERRGWEGGERTQGVREKGSEST